jgi:hypothetical protein
MPDLTLYEDDVELIRDALAAYKRTCSATEDAEACERLSNVLLDRLVQHLHPVRLHSESELDVLDL